MRHVKFNLEDSQYQINEETTDVFTLPMVVRVNGESVTIGEADLKFDNGVLNIVNAVMTENGVKALGLDAYLLSIAGGANPISHEFVMKNPRPEPNGEILSTDPIVDIGALAKKQKTPTLSNLMRRLQSEGYNIQGDYVIDYDGNKIPLTEAKKTDGTPLIPEE